MNDSSDTTTPRLNPAYIGDVNRIVRSLETRCLQTGTPPSTGAIATQVTLRGVRLNISTARRELTAIRAVLRDFLDEGGWAEGIDSPDWLEAADADQVSELLMALSETADRLIEMGRDTMGKMISRMMASGYTGSEEDAAAVLSGVDPHRSPERSRDRENLEPITRDDMMNLDLDLLDHPHDLALKSFGRKTADLKAMLRVFMRAIWLTGMRPIEVFDCRLMLGDPSRTYALPERQAIAQSPEAAALAGLLIPIDSLDTVDWGGFVNSVRNVQRATDIPPVLLIKNAKTSNANPDLMRIWRAQILEGLGDNDLAVICLAAQLHGMPVPRKRRTNMISGMSRKIARIATEALPDRRSPINLYAFRHDFSTRARRRMSLHEVAALMGHTARSSTHSYGKARTRRSGSSGGDWLPRADQAQAERLRLAWGGDGADLMPGDPGTPETGPEADD